MQLITKKTREKSLKCSSQDSVLSNEPVMFLDQAQTTQQQDVTTK